MEPSGNVHKIIIGTELYSPLDDIFQLTKSGGTLTIVEMGDTNNVDLPLFNALSREVDIKGAFRYANEYLPNSFFYYIKMFYH